MGDTLMTPSKAYRQHQHYLISYTKYKGRWAQHGRIAGGSIWGVGSGVGSLWDDGLGEDEDTGDHDGGSMDNSTYCGWTLHGIWQPAVCAHS